jgi:hypothetical protein
MYEVFAAITDELGSRVIPTGDGSLNRDIAENLMMRRMIQYPETRFFIDFVPSEDYFHAY